MLARERLRREGPGHTLEATALVHELYLKLAGQHRASWHSRLHFLRVAAQMMRRILIDHARIGSAQKRGQGLKRVELEDMAIELDEAVDILALDEALARLAAEDARAAEVVELKFFAGLGVPEIAAALGVSEPTIKRDWARARAWLWAELREERRA
jgi:RNA polymerase sigma factor (TIGR02999 family)